MATTPTNLPVPSKSPIDLKFNAGKIDEFVTSFAQQYIDRFGNTHYTIEGLKQLVLQQIYNLGWNLKGTFQGGGTVTAAGDLLQDTSSLIWYRWDDLSTLPKTVSSGSTPSSAGGTGPGKWQPVDVADVLRKDLATSAGAGMVGYDQSEIYSDGTVGGNLKKVNTDVSHLKSLLPESVRTLATALKKANDGSSISIACYGDSLTYGQDTSSTGGQPPINGATQGRSPNPYPDSLSTSLSTIGITNIVINRGYPGDTSADGLTRWASASATDVAILMYGTNDAMNFGGTGLVGVDDFRKNMSEMIEREISKGAAVILMSPPNVSDPVSNAKIAPYRAQVKYLANAYAVDFIDSAEQISTITRFTTDNVHLTTFAYNELGWHLASLFARRDGNIAKVCAGEIYHPTDHIGYGGTMQIIAGAKGNNLMVKLMPGEVYVIGVYCIEDVTPVIHSANSQSTASLISAFYAGLLTSTTGVESAELSHVSSIGFRQKLTAQNLRKGFRTLYISNSGTVPAYIEAIEFQSLSQPATILGFFTKSDALSGMFQPARLSSSSSGWSAVDTARKMTADCQVVAMLTLPNGNNAGIALMNGMQKTSTTFTNNALFALRSGASLIIKEIINGSQPADVTVGSVFPATGEWKGEIEMEVSGTTCNVYIDGVLKATKSGVSINRGYPALFAQQNQKLICHSYLLKGYTKPIYE